MTASMVVSFALVVLLGSMSPGPDFALVLRRSALSGRGPGTLTAFGIAAGVAVWAVAAATGVAALVAVSAVVYTAVRLVGAAYLLYLGIRALLAARRAGRVEAEPGGARTVRGWTAFRQGLLCNLLNPKAAVFFVALLPQFLPSRPGLVDTLALSAVSAVVNVAWFTAVATLVGSFRRLFARPRLRRAVDAVTGTALVALGLRIVATARTV